MLPVSVARRTPEHWVIKWGALRRRYDVPQGGVAAWLWHWDRPAPAADPDPATLVRGERRNAERRDRLGLRFGRGHLLGSGMLRANGRGVAFPHSLVLAQSGAALLDLATQMTGVRAKQRVLDLAPGVDVVGAGAGRAAYAPELQFEEVARRGTRATA